MGGGGSQQHVESIASRGTPGGFAERVRSAVIWRWGSQVLSQVITWTATLIVIRLLSPHDYGLFAMTQVVLAALNFVNGYSFATSLIQTQDVTERRMGQVFGLLLVANVSLAALQWLMAPLAASYYGQPVVADMLRVQSLIYLTTPFTALPAALLARRMEFRTQALISLLCAIVGAITALAMAWLGYGVWALVVAPIVMFAVRAIGLTAKTGLLVRPVFDFRGAGEVIGFGTALTLCQLFWIVQSQSDIFIAGKLFDPHDLGLYSEALFLTLIFTGRFLPPLNEVAFPAYSELRHSGQSIGPAFLKSARITMLLSAPLYIGLSMTAGPAMTVLFGPKWIEMIPLVAGLALAMPAMALQIICSPATNAMSRPRIYVYSSLAGAILMPIGFLVGSRYGALGLVHAWWVTAPLLLLVTLALTLPVIGVRPIELVRTLIPVIAATAVMAAVVWMVGRAVSGQPAAVQLVGQVIAGVMAYGGTLWFGWPQLVRETWTMLRAR